MHRAMKTLGTASGRSWREKPTEGVRKKDCGVLCRVVVRHTEQIRQIRKIRQIRDPALLLAAALGNRKNTPGKGFTDLSDFRVHGSDFSISTGG